MLSPARLDPRLLEHVTERPDRRFGPDARWVVGSEAKGTLVDRDSCLARLRL